MDIAMNGDAVPDHNHIARYCKPSTVVNDRIQPTAFYLRRGEDSLSVNWLEHFACLTRETEIIALRSAYSIKNYETRINGRIAVLNVGKSRQYVLRKSTDKRNIYVLHHPQDHDTSHSGVHNMRPDDILIATLLRKTIHEIYPAQT